MKNSKTLKIYLVISGLLLTFIGGATLLMPVEMKASAGIDISGNISVLNDIRAMSALLLGIALISLTGALSKKLSYTAALMSTLTFLTLGIGRAISIFSDGDPVDGLVKATILEFVLGIIGAILFITQQNKVNNQ